MNTKGSKKCPFIVYSEKTEFMYLIKNVTVFSLNGKLLKLEDEPIYLSNNISSRKNDVNFCID